MRSNPVSGDSLCKTGIFADVAGDFCRLRPPYLQTKGPETESKARKPAFPAHSRLSWGTWVNAGMAGWGGRDRTSEWWNQNPLPYRLATPQQAAPEDTGRSPRSAFRQRRSTEGVLPFQQTIVRTLAGIGPGDPDPCTGRYTTLYIGHFAETCRGRTAHPHGLHTRRARIPRPNALDKRAASPLRPLATSCHPLPSAGRVERTAVS